MRLDRRPVVVGLQDRLVAAPGRRAVPGNEQGLGHGDVDALEEREQQRSAPRVPDQHGVVIEGVIGQHLCHGRGDRFEVHAGIVRRLHVIAALDQPAA